MRLHDGTIINPIGLTLAPGERVTILGANDGDRPLANEIDTPYAPAYAAVPGPYPYYGSGCGVGYPGYGAFGFGFRGRFRRIADHCHPRSRDERRPP